MNMQAIRKAICLIFVYILIIIGIFILQFRTDSTIIEKIGNLQITLSKIDETESGSVPVLENGLSAIKNKLIATYNGISFTCDDQNPVKVLMKNQKEPVPVKLLSYSKKDEYSIDLLFSNDVNIILDMVDTTSTSAMYISTILPSNISSVYLPYSYSLTLNLLKEEENQIVFESKKKSWALSGLDLSDGYLHLSRQNNIGSYAIYDETKKFSFDSITELEIAEASVYNTTVENFKNALISSFKADNSSSKYTEQNIVAYVAAQAENGNYSSAIEEIPQNFKKGNSRTYLSAPYFNNLSAMDHKLDGEIKEREFRIAKAASNPSLDIFTVHNIANSLAVYPNPDHIKKIFNYVLTADMSKASLSEVSGLLSAYVQLCETRPEFATQISSVMSSCIERITSACSFDNNVITISENDTFLSVVQAVEIGTSILRYGQITDNKTLVKAGRVLINSYMSEASSFDLRTLVNLYPMVAYNNWYYPHITIIDSKDSEIRWAWTCSRSITETHNTADNTVTYTIDFPEGSTHYVIMKGIPQFDSIYIYDMAFRTDPRFESYNSSGYIYKAETGALLLKSRHKKQMETVRIEISKNQTRPVSKVEKPAEKPVEKTESKPAATKPASSTSAAPVVETKPAEKPVEKAEPKSETPATSSEPAAVPADNSVPAAEPAVTEPVVETPVATTPSETAKSEYDVYITAYDSAQRRDVITILRRYTRHTQNTASKLLDSLETEGEQMVQEKLTAAKADELISRLEKFGCTAIKR